MAPRTPRRPHAAEPFVSFSLSKIGSSRIAQIIEANKASVDEKLSTPSAKGKKRSAKRALRHSDATETTESPKPNKPNKRRKLSHNEISTPKTFDASVLGIENDTLDTPSTKGRTKVTKSGDTSLPKLQIETQNALHENLSQLSDGPPRRSSTVSLTDSVTRISGRTRKLTAKAQALAGTNFLPSLQNTPDVESDLVQNMRENSLEQGTKDDGNQSQSLTGVNTPITVADDAPVESVETPTIRSSTRERKPTARAIELETTKISRKRLASPAASDQASKIAKHSPVSNKPSKLRGMSGDYDDSLLELLYDIPPRSQDEPMFIAQIDANENVDDHIRIPDSQEPPTERNSDQPDDVGHTDKLASPDRPNELPHDAEVVTVESHEKSSIEDSVEPPVDQDEEEGLLSLPPSSRLVAFAKIAAEWSDSDDGSDEDDIDLSVAGETATDSTTMTEKACRIYLQQKSSISGMSEPTVKSTSQSTATSPVAKARTVARRPSSKTSQANHRLGGKTRRSTRIKPHPLSQQSNFHEPKTHTTSRTKPVIERESSSFERRMQSDYLEAKEKMAGAFVQKTENTSLDTLQPNHPLPSLQDTNSQTVQNQPPSASSKSGLVNGSFLKDSEIPNLDLRSSNPDTIPANNIPTKAATNLLQNVNTMAKSPFLQKTTLSSSEIGKVDSKARKVAQKPNKIKIKGGGKSSDGVFVPQSLNEKSVHEKGHGTKEYPVLAPPQAKSIKLRFTTIAK